MYVLEEYLMLLLVIAILSGLLFGGVVVIVVADATLHRITDATYKLGTIVRQAVSSARPDLNKFLHLRPSQDSH